ncbi:hypothetical protein [Paenibacillus pini]
MVEWEFSKTSVVGYGRLLDTKGKLYNVQFDNEGIIEVTTTKQNKQVKIPLKVIKLIQQKLKEE